MQDDFTIVQAARLVGITPRILTQWLQDAGISTRTGADKRAQYLTRQQVAMLAAAHGRILPDDTSLSALAGQIGRLQGEVDTLKRRLDALDAHRMTARPPRLPIDVSPQPSSHASDLSDASEQHFSLRSTGGLRAADAARVLAARHGANYNTVRQWDWPAEALTSEDAAIRWGLDYVRGDYRREGKRWRWHCDVSSCPCHDGG